MSHEHWPHGNFTHFQKNKLGYFWPRLPRVKVFVFLTFSAKDTNGESFNFSWSFLAKVTKGESFCFSWSFLAKVTKGESFCFLGHFWPRITTVQVWFWAFLAKNTNGEIFGFALSFLAKDNNGESFFFSWSFLAKVTNGERFVFSWSFLAKDTNGESFCFSWTFLAKVTFVGHFGYEYQLWKLCLWFEILSKLWPLALPNASSRSLEAISGTPLCKQEFALWEAIAGMGLQVWVYSYTGRQALAWKYKYLVPQNGALINHCQKWKYFQNSSNFLVFDSMFVESYCTI